MIRTSENEYKVVLVGESSVGKSSILLKFVDDEFHDSLLSTIGVDFKFRKFDVDGTQAKLQIWDTAGQETFRSIVSAYYNSADAIIIVYDTTSYRSFQCVEEYWLNQAISQNKNDALIILIGNKIDDQPRREVENFSVESLLDKYKINAHYEVSAKQGTNITNTFTNLVRLLKKRQRSEQKDSLPSNKSGKPITLSTKKVENSQNNSNQRGTGQKIPSCCK